MVTAEKFNKSAATQKWDQVKIVCTQPFNKNIKYGISFLTVTSVEENDAGLEFDFTKNIELKGSSCVSAH